MSSPPQNKEKGEALSTGYTYLIVSITLNFLLCLILLIVFVIIFCYLFRTLRQMQLLSKRIKTSQKVIKDQLSPKAEQFLEICNDLGFSSDKVRKLYAEYDMRRRKVTTKYMHYDDPDVAKIVVFQKFFNESHFMKGGGFRMHRQLHELAGSDGMSPSQGGNTILAPRFK